MKNYHCCKFFTRKITMSPTKSNSESDSLENEEIIVSNLFCEAIEAENYQDEADETLMERVQSLSEIFSSVIRKPFGIFGRFLTSIYRGACEASWIFFIIVAITFGPAVFETERQRQLPLSDSKKSPESENSPQ